MTAALYLAFPPPLPLPPPGIQVSLVTPQAAAPTIATTSSPDLRYLALLAVIVPVVGLVLYVFLCRKVTRHTAILLS